MYFCSIVEELLNLKVRRTAKRYSNHWQFYFWGDSLSAEVAFI